MPIDVDSFQPLLYIVFDDYLNKVIYSTNGPLDPSKRQREKQHSTYLPGERNDQVEKLTKE